MHQRQWLFCWVKYGIASKFPFLGENSNLMPSHICDCKCTVHFLILWCHLVNIHKYTLKNLLKVPVVKCFYPGLFETMPKQIHFTGWPLAFDNKGLLAYTGSAFKWWKKCYITFRPTDWILELRPIFSDYVITSVKKYGMEIYIHSLTSTVQPLTFLECITDFIPQVAGNVIIYPCLE